MRLPYILLLLFILPFILIGVAVFILAIPLPAPFPESFSHDRNLYAAIGTGLCGLGLLALIFIYTLFTFLRAGRWAAPAAKKLGLRGSYLPPFGSKYTGAVNGRKVTVAIRATRWGGFSRIDFAVAGKQMPQIAIGRGRPLPDGGKSVRLATASDPDFRDLHVLAESESIGRNFLADPAVRTALIALFAQPGSAEAREIYIQPSSIRCRTAHQPADANLVEQRIITLVALAAAAEGHGAPRP